MTKQVLDVQQMQHLQELGHHEKYESLIDAAYSLLCWAIEDKFVETNKNE